MFCYPGQQNVLLSRIDKSFCYPGLQKVLLSRIAKIFKNFAIQDSKNFKKICYPGQQNFAIQDSKTLLSMIAKQLSILDNKTFGYPGYQNIQLSWIAKHFAILDSKHSTILDSKKQLSRIVKVFGQQDIQLSRIAKDRRNIKLSRILKDSKTFSYPGQQDIQLPGQ